MQHVPIAATALSMALMTFALQAPAAEVPAPDPLNPVGANLEVPPDWRVRLDDEEAEVLIGADADSVDLFFVSMTPGWHITTGPRAIFHHPGAHAAGDFRVESRIHLFDPGKRREAFGIFFGGKGLDGGDPHYDYFVIRNSGEFLVKRRAGSETVEIHPWTPSEAIVTFSPGMEGTATNVLALTAIGESVALSINEVEVARLPRGELQLDGKVGFRVNHHLNLHISTLEIEPVSTSSP